MAVILLRGTVVLVKVLKGSNVATQSGELDGFHVGDTRELPPRLAFPMTAAGWVRPMLDRLSQRRADKLNGSLDAPDRRLLPDRRSEESS